jgi:hypothetical protein
MVEGATDTMVVGMLGTVRDNVTLRFPDALLYPRDVEFRRLYIHDTLDNLGSGAGSHAFTAWGIVNLNAGEIRAERTTDDPIALSGGTFGLGIQPRNTLRSVIAHANLWGGTVDKSQDGVNLIGAREGDGEANGVIAFGRGLTVDDVSVIGIDMVVMVNSILGSRVNGFVAGGQRSTQRRPTIVHSPPLDMGGAVPVKSGGLYPNALSNSFVSLYGGSTGGCGLDLTGEFSDSILFYGQRGSDPRLVNLSKLSRSFVDISGTISGHALDHSTTDTLHQLNTDAVTLDDSVLLTGQGSLFGSYGTGLSPDGRPSSVTLQRSILGMGDVASNLVAKMVSNIVQPSTWVLDGLLVSQTAVNGVDTITLTGATDVIASDVCFQADAPPEQMFPPPILLNPTLSVYETSPFPPSSQMNLAQLLELARLTCPAPGPTAIGIAELRRSVADLGDGVNGHLDLFGHVSSGAQLALAQADRPRWPQREHRERRHRPRPPKKRCELPEL